MSRAERRREERDRKRPKRVSSPLMEGFDPKQFDTHITAVNGRPLFDNGRLSWLVTLHCGHGTITRKAGDDEGASVPLVALMQQAPPEVGREMPCVTCQTGLTARDFATAHGLASP